MQRPRDQLLSAAALAFNQHRKGRRRRTLDAAAHLRHRGARAKQVGHRRDRQAARARRWRQTRTAPWPPRPSSSTTRRSRDRAACRWSSVRPARRRPSRPIGSVPPASRRSPQRCGASVTPAAIARRRNGEVDAAAVGGHPGSARPPRPRRTPPRPRAADHEPAGTPPSARSARRRTSDTDPESPRWRRPSDRACRERAAARDANRRAVQRQRRQASRRHMAADDVFPLAGRRQQIAEQVASRADDRRQPRGAKTNDPRKSGRWPPDRSARSTQGLRQNQPAPGGDQRFMAGARRRDRDGNVALARPRRSPTARCANAALRAALGHQPSVGDSLRVRAAPRCRARPRRRKSPRPTATGDFEAADDHRVRDRVVDGAIDFRVTSASSYRARQKSVRASTARARAALASSPRARAAAAAALAAVSAWIQTRELDRSRRR